MKTSKQSISNINLITIEEKEANLTNAEQFKKDVIEGIDAGEKTIVISFVNVEYLDSSFLGALVAILKALLPQQGKLILIDLNDDIINLFQLTRLDKIFLLKSNFKDAIKELNG